MTRFQTATASAAVSIIAAGLFLRGDARWVVIAAVMLAYLVLLGLGVSFIKWRFFGDAFCRGRTDRPYVALTFDDGPDPAATPALLDVLEDLKVPAAFFCVAERVRLHADTAALIVKKGHTIGNHTARHAWWTNFLFGRRLAGELADAQNAVIAAAGVAPRFYRPPMGLTNPHVASALARLDLVLVGWDVRSLDLRLAPDAVVARVTRLARPGSIILMHDGGADPEKLCLAVREIVSILRDKGLEFVTLDTLVHGSLPEVDAA